MKRALLFVLLAALGAWAGWTWQMSREPAPFSPSAQPESPAATSVSPPAPAAPTPTTLNAPASPRFALPEPAPTPLPAVPSPPPAPPLPDGVRIDRIHVRKAAREMTVYAGGFALKTYRIALGNAPVGPKQFEGDGRTPEGRYTISGRNPNSRYHLSLRISYPSEADRAFAAKAKRPAGGDIMIHGLPNGFVLNGPVAALGDWTIGCVAVTNEEIEELWRAVPDGCEVELAP